MVKQRKCVGCEEISVGRLNSPNCFIMSTGRILSVPPRSHTAYLRKWAKSGRFTRQQTQSMIKVTSSAIGFHIFKLHNDIAVGIREYPASQAQIDSLFCICKKFEKMPEYNRFLERESEVSI
jgi:hypothetical protein